MGRDVEAVLRERSHEPIVVRRGEPFPAGCEVGIDFTEAAAVVPNVAAALQAGSRYVVGTTGWSDREGEVRALVERHGSGLVHGPNFSLGVGLYFEIVRHAASLLASFPEYDPYVLEKHHRGKRDAPSGTAHALARLVHDAGGARTRALSDFEGALPAGAFHVAAVRAGGIPGEHTVGFDCGDDEILIEHRARSRRAFAQGAVRAAEWIAEREGFFSFAEVLRSLWERRAADAG
jgi:4-hydroxy-tetrahydrodipicolinate reductase